MIAQDFLKARREAVAKLEAEFPSLIRLLPVPKGKKNWRQHEFLPQEEQAEVAAAPPQLPDGPCLQCAEMARRVVEMEEKIKKKSM